MADIVLWNGNPSASIRGPKKVWVDRRTALRCIQSKAAAMSDFELGQPGEGVFKMTRTYAVMNRPARDTRLRQTTAIVGGRSQNRGRLAADEAGTVLFRGDRIIAAGCRHHGGHAIASDRRAWQVGGGRYSGGFFQTSDCWTSTASPKQRQHPSPKSPFGAAIGQFRRRSSTSVGGRQQWSAPVESRVPSWLTRCAGSDLCGPRCSHRPWRRQLSCDTVPRAFEYVELGEKWRSTGRW